MSRILLLFSLLMITIQPTLAAMKSRPAMLRLTFEEIDLPAGETMGLLGTDYLVHLNRYIYTGLGIYSAVTGERGGFFTGGLESGFKYPLSRKLEFDTGIFVGGGGGGAAPQGGGLMIRPHVGLAINTDLGRFGLQASLVKFPNGDIDSTQFSLRYERPLTLLHSSRWLDDEHAQSYRSSFYHRNRPSEQDFSVLQQNYDLPGGTLNTGGNVQDANMRLIGVEWDFYFDDNKFFRLQTLGAFGGNSDGYASVLFGLGYRYTIMRATSIKLGATVGASGGGDVFTGGGLTMDLALNLQHRFDNGILAGIRAGLVDAPDGDFEATSYGLYLGYGDREPDKKRITGTDMKARHWRIRATHQTYMPTGDTSRKGQTTPDNRDVHLVAMQADVFINKRFYLTGQAIGAYDGGAGGYAVGVVGAGISQPFWKNSRLLFNAEALIGAAGGGGLNVGDGLIGQAMVGIAYRTSRSTSIHLALGRTQSNEGNFEADTINIGLAYRFTTLAWK